MDFIELRLKKHGRLSTSLFRYGLDYVQMAIQRLIGFGKKEEFKEMLAILRRQNPDRIRVLWNLSCTEKKYKLIKELFLP